MKQYIDKATIVADIKKRIKTNKKCMLGLRNLDYYQGEIDALNDTISFLNTIEVKEVDLEKEIEKYLIANAKLLIEGNSKLVVRHIAEHFFELGLKYKKGK